MFKMKMNKKLMIPVFAMVLVVAMTGVALADSVASIMGGTGTDYGDPELMSGYVYRSAECFDESTSDYLTTYLKYGTTNWQFPLTIDWNDQWIGEVSELPSGYHAVQAVLEALWGDNYGKHYASDDEMD